MIRAWIEYRNAVARYEANGTFEFGRVGSFPQEQPLTVLNLLE